ncbi:WRKY transcription factor 71-like [Rutidosis leptorrhynchoides]|uniref:WRKY transcription factor 71-like n=1 Tax=Rutidosis leptorrhynchoides TaxID=125765 RepID=UPI003A98F3FF
MSHDQTDFYYHDPFHDDQRTSENLYSFFSPTNNSITIRNDDSSPQNHQRFQDYMGVTHFSNGSTDFNSPTTTFGYSPSSSQQFFSLDQDDQKPVLDPRNLIRVTKTTPIGTPNSSSVLSSSTEAGDDEHELKYDKNENQPISLLENGVESSKKVNNIKKKDEKKQREHRFAFMTKSDIDHLEDGYRWRKYGQKAVKNSSYPRSYYRCTTQKCKVKKRVERSYEDPSTVITTYQGQHNHHLPATLRGNVGGGGGMLYTQSMMAARGGGISSPHRHQQTTPLRPIQQFEINNPDYGLLQDMVPSIMTFKQEP